MRATLVRKPAPQVHIRKAAWTDIDALMELEQRVFDTDRLSRRSLRRFLKAPTAAVLVGEDGGELAGTAIVLFRQHSTLARLYSIAVAPHMGGRGIGPMLLQAAEDVARSRHATAMRLEVHHTNQAAISRYRKSGYREFGRIVHYYEDGGDALRFDKPLNSGAPAA